MFWQCVVRGSLSFANPFFACWPFLFLGIVGGIPMSLVSSTISAVLKTNDIDKSIIGFFSLVTLPYSFRFFLSLIVESLNLGSLARFFNINQKSVLFLVSNLLMIIPIAMFALSDFSEQTVFRIFIYMLLIATCASISDIAIDGLRIENVEHEVSGFAISSAVLGYRIGLLLGGGGALLIAHYLPFSDNINWKLTYASLYCFIIFCSIVPILLTRFTNVFNFNNAKEIFQIKEEESATKFNFNYKLTRLLTLFKLILKDKDSIFAISFASLYKLGDSLSGAMLTVFLLDIGFSLGEIGFVVKFIGFITLTIGSFAGSVCIKRYGLMNSLFVFGICSMLSNATSIIQYFVGYKIWMLYFTISIEDIFHGASMASFLTFFTYSCKDKPYPATRYSLLVGASAVSRMLIPILGGFIAKYYGWFWYFLAAIIIAIPGLLLLIPLNKTFANLQSMCKNKTP